MLLLACENSSLSFESNALTVLLLDPSALTDLPDAKVTSELREELDRELLLLSFLYARYIFFCRSIVIFSHRVNILGFPNRPRRVVIVFRSAAAKPLK